MYRTLLALPFWSLRLLGAVEQARLLHDIGEQHEQDFIGTKDFTNQHEAQQRHIRLITMGTGFFQERSPLRNLFSPR
jgi:hypothetical protein